MSKLNKIKLNADIILNIGTPTPGEYGRVLVVQDNIGFHTVNLPENHFGNIVVEPTPGKTTLLEYVVDDTGVFWTSTILTPADDISAPSTITDLTWNYLDAESVQIRFTAPTGNHTANADKYLIYYSNAPITDSTVITSLLQFKNNYIPKAPGSTETFTITKLTPNQVYYFVVVAQKTTFGKTLSGAASNIITFTTLPLEGGGNDGDTSILIPIKPENVTTWYTCFEIDTDGTVLDEKQLVDYSNTSIVEGAPSGFPPKLMFMLHDNGFKDDYYNMEQLFVFDFEELYTLTDVYIVPVQGSNDKQIYISADGTNWTPAGSIAGDAKKNLWTQADLLTDEIADVRYVKIVLAVTDRDKWNGAAFLGRRQSAQNIKGIKYKNTSTALTLPERIGTNSNVAQNIAVTSKVGDIVRLYSNHAWYLDGIPKYLQGSTTFSLDTMDYKFANSNVGNSDAYFQQLQSSGLSIMYCMVGMPIFLSSADDTTKTRKPLDPGLEMILANTTNPLNYKYISQFYWQLAARYGSTSGQSDSLFRINSGDTIHKGLGYVKYFEMGLNEGCASTPNENTHENAEEMAALLSAIYDGHKGALGPGYGILDADPTAVCIMPGLTAMPIGYKLAMFRWFDANRGVGDYPISVINEHFYNIAGGRKVTDNLYGQLNMYSLPPEQGAFIPFVQENISLRNSDPTKQSLEFWISEYGYDEHLGSPFSPKDSIPANRALKKALWTIRAFMLADYLGIDRFIQYAQFGYHTLAELPDSAGQNIYVNFSTCGYLDGNDTSGTHPLVAFYYATAFKKAMQGYKFSHAVRFKGNAMTNETVTKTTNPDLYVFAYKPDDDTKKPMLIMWLGNEFLANTANIDLSVTAAETTINTLSFTGLETSHSEAGTTGSTASSVDGFARKITVAVTATPKIIYTDNIGTPKLIDPVDITVQALTPTQIKLAWTDKNLGINNTRVYRSTSPSSGFTQIYNDYIDNASFTDTGLAEDTSYYYQIQFELDGAISTLSASYGVATLRTITVPGSFHTTGQSPSTINLAWTYSDDDAAHIDGFELWRSNAVAGVYTKVATISNNLTSYINTGLVANTTYYYKLRAYKGLSFGLYTTALTTTTDPITLDAPVLQTAQTSYSGDRLTLTFDLPMADPSGLESYFTIVESPGTTNRFISATSVSVNPNDSTKVNVYLASGVTSSAHTIQFSYDGVGGTLQSIYGVKCGSQSSISVTNRYTDATLVSKILKVNVCNDTHSSGLSDWNNYSVTNVPYNATQLVIDVNNITGGTTGYKFTIVEDHPLSHVQNNYDVTASAGSYFSTGDTVNSLFPIAVRTVGAEILGSGNNKLIMSLMKLDSTKLYNVKLYGWEFAGVGGVLSVQGNAAGAIQTLVTSGNTSKYIYLTNLKASNITLPVTSANPVTDGYSANKITINCEASIDKVSVSALIFEEVIDN